MSTHINPLVESFSSGYKWQLFQQYAFKCMIVFIFPSPLLRFKILEIIMGHQVFSSNAVERFVLSKGKLSQRKNSLPSMHMFCILLSYCPLFIKFFTNSLFDVPLGSSFQMWMYFIFPRARFFLELIRNDRYCYTQISNLLFLYKLVPHF